MDKKVRVAFICVHNSCRSQIAEALGNAIAFDVMTCYSAGTQRKAQINQDGVRLMKQVYGIDMENNQYPKVLADLPPVDIVITMGCNVECPNLPCSYREDWGLQDPSGKDDGAFLSVMETIEQHIFVLKQKIETHTIPIA